MSQSRGRNFWQWGTQGMIDLTGGNYVLPEYVTSIKTVDNPPRVSVFAKDYIGVFIVGGFETFDDAEEFAAMVAEKVRSVE